MSKTDRTEEEWIQAYKDKDALWIHDGDNTKPHALLTSGKHSNGFFNSRIVIADGEMLGDAAWDLAYLFGKLNKDERDPDIVVGPQTGATKLAELLSAMFESVIHRHKCTSLSPEKHEADGVKSMLFTDGEKADLSGKHVLLCEDVMTTGGSVDLTVDAVVAAGGILLPYVLVLVNRSGLSEINGRKIIALIDKPMTMWGPDECPLCKAGSEAIRPKDNWKELTA